MSNAVVEDSSTKVKQDLDHISLWLAEYKDHPNTYRAYKKDSDKFYKWLVKYNITLARVLKNTVIAFVNYLSKETVLLDKRTVLSPTTINSTINRLCNMFDYLIVKKYLKNNPFAAVKKQIIRPVKRKPITKTDYLTKQEFQEHVLKYIANMPQQSKKEKLVYSRVQWLFNFIFATGCRVSEIINARMSDFINRNNQWWLKVMWLKDVIEIPITNETMSCLANYRIAHGLEPLPHVAEVDVGLLLNIRNNKNITDVKLVYDFIRDTCLTISKDLESVNPALAKKFAAISPTKLRHSSAFAQLEDGISLEIVRKNQRHSRIETTIRYTHHAADEQYAITNARFRINSVK